MEEEVETLEHQPDAEDDEEEETDEEDDEDDDPEMTAMLMVWYIQVGNRLDLGGQCPLKRVTK